MAGSCRLCGTSVPSGLLCEPCERAGVVLPVHPEIRTFALMEACPRCGRGDGYRCVYPSGRAVEQGGVHVERMREAYRAGIVPAWSGPAWLGVSERISGEGK